VPAARSAILYRMVLPEHTCPYGVRARELLDEAGFEVEEHLLTTREQVDETKERLGVSTTPQVIIDDERIGGSEELEQYLVRETESREQAL
jgi:glutaredoxin 3